MIRSIKLRYIFSYIALALLLLVLVNLYGQRVIYNKLLQQEQSQLYQEAELIVKEYMPNMTILSSTDSILQKHFRSLQALTNMRVWLVSTTSRILMDSDQTNSLQDKYINNYDASFLSGQTLVGAYPKGLITEKMIMVIYPITDSLDTNGYLVLMTPESQLRADAANYTDTILICCMMILLASGGVFLFLYWQSVRPLRRMTKIAQKYADGQLDEPMQKLPNGDYAQLASAIRFLGERMQRQAEYQRNFVANVSHDFRSPLTSIKGYTEALSDGTIPPEMQEKYFRIILFEVERLEKLTQNLLELNQLDNNGIALERECFDINETIRNATLPFEQRCLQKKLSFDLIFEQKEQTVYGDHAKIQQVLQNLIDNAIKFSHTDAAIRIQTSLRNQKVFVSVKDYGIGIPKESLSKIWERFYKTDLSRGKDKTGTGLGLSIVREIIEAHGENITVISTENAGTEFIFSLPQTMN